MCKPTGFTYCNGWNNFAEQNVKRAILRKVNFCMCMHHKMLFFHSLLLKFKHTRFKENCFSALFKIPISFTCTYKRTWIQFKRSIFTTRASWPNLQKNLTHVRSETSAILTCQVVIWVILGLFKYCSDKYFLRCFLPLLRLHLSNGDTTWKIRLKYTLFY